LISFQNAKIAIPILADINNTKKIIKKSVLFTSPPQNNDIKKDSGYKPKEIPL